MSLSPLTLKECAERYKMHMDAARGYADRSRIKREAGDLYWSVWEQNAARSQYKIAREYLECTFVLLGQPRTNEPRP